MKGITGNRIFVDHYYLYQKIHSEIMDLQNKDEIKDEENTEESEQTESDQTSKIYKEKLEKDCCEHYLGALKEAFKQIKTLIGDHQKSYLDWIRWNAVLIKTNLKEHEQMPHCSDHFPAIKEMQISLDMIMKNHFKLTEAEKGANTEYKHAFEKVYRSHEQKRRIDYRVLGQSGRLFINYVNYLKNRCYIDIWSTNFDRLESESEFITKELQKLGESELAADVKSTFEQYKQFCTFDDTAQNSVDELLHEALKDAHKRATENQLQQKLRLIKETMERIKNAAYKFKNIIQTSPLQIFKNFCTAVAHPMKAGRALKNFAIENPWKCAAVVVGSLIIGVATGGVAVGAFVLADMVFVSVAFAPTALVAFGAITSAAVTAGVVHGAVTGGGLVAIDEQLQVDIGTEIGKEAALIEGNEANGLKIAENINLDAIKRQTFKEIDKKFHAFQETQRQVVENRNSQIDTMTFEELKAHENALNEQQQEYENELKENEEMQHKSAENIAKSQEDLKKVQEAQEIVDRSMQDKAEKNSISARSRSLYFESDEDQ
uniref:Uncharacterized protein n=1 Tax=Panagrolaimus sp. ES5 TaxID=591445 RepID=A0AC34FFA7_9BILA